MCTFGNNAVYQVLSSDLYLQEMDVVLSAVKLLQSRLFLFELFDLLLKTLHQSFSLTERSLLINVDELGDFRPHSLDGSDHLVKHLFALSHGSLCRALKMKRIHDMFTAIQNNVAPVVILLPDLRLH